jgi:hypothetical protein
VKGEAKPALEWVHSDPHPAPAGKGVAEMEHSAEKFEGVATTTVHPVDGPIPGEQEAKTDHLGHAPADDPADPKAWVEQIEESLADPSPDNCSWCKAGKMSPPVQTEHDYPLGRWRQCENCGTRTGERIMQDTQSGEVFLEKWSEQGYADAAGEVVTARH